MCRAEPRALPGVQCPVRTVFGEFTIGMREGQRAVSHGSEITIDHTEHLMGRRPTSTNSTPWGPLGDIDQLLESERQGALSLRDDDSSAAFPTPNGTPG